MAVRLLFNFCPLFFFQNPDLVLPNWKRSKASSISLPATSSRATSTSSGATASAAPPNMSSSMTQGWNQYRAKLLVQYHYLMSTTNILLVCWQQKPPCSPWMNFFLGFLWNVWRKISVVLSRFSSVNWYLTTSYICKRAGLLRANLAAGNIINWFWVRLGHLLVVASWANLFVSSSTVIP